MLKKGDMDGKVVWLRVVKAMEELLRCRPASGEVYNKHAYTAAHRTLPFGTRVPVINLENGRSVMLTVNDRGPFVRGRIIDVSQRAARALGSMGQGIVRLRVTAVGMRRG